MVKINNLIDVFLRYLTDSISRFPCWLLDKKPPNGYYKANVSSDEKTPTGYRKNIYYSSTHILVSEFIGFSKKSEVFARPKHEYTNYIRCNIIKLIDLGLQADKQHTANTCNCK